MTDAERKAEDWDTHGATSVIELDDGTHIFPSQDDGASKGQER